METRHHHTRWASTAKRCLGEDAALRHDSCYGLTKRMAELVGRMLQR
jgi:hypothetical protein